MSKDDKKMGIEKPKYRHQREFIKGKKKPKKDKRPWQEKHYVCPFCEAFIPDAPRPKDFPRFQWWSEREGKCACGAFRVEKACPCCHRTTWFKPDDRSLTSGEYRHPKWSPWSACGFIGRLKPSTPPGSEEEKL